jgi:hypothetical protein
LNRRPAARFAFDFFEPLPIHIEVSDAPLTSDAGLLPLRQFDQRIVRRTLVCVLLIMFMMPTAAVAQGLPPVPSLLPLLADLPVWRETVLLIRCKERVREVRQQIEALKAQPAPKDADRHKEKLHLLTESLKILEGAVRHLEEELRR